MPGDSCGIMVSTCSVTLTYKRVSTWKNRVEKLWASNLNSWDPFKSLIIQVWRWQTCPHSQWVCLRHSRDLEVTCASPIKYCRCGRHLKIESAHSPISCTLRVCKCAIARWGVWGTYGKIMSRWTNIDFPRRIPYEWIFQLTSKSNPICLWEPCAG